MKTRGLKSKNIQDTRLNKAVGFKDHPMTKSLGARAELKSYNDMVKKGPQRAKALGVGGIADRMGQAATRDKANNLLKKLKKGK